MGLKFRGVLVPHLTQSPLGWGVTSIPSGILIHAARYGPRIGWELCPFEEGGAGPHLTQCGQVRGLPAGQVSSWSVQPFSHGARTLQTGQTGQTEKGPIAYGEPFYKRSPKNVLAWWPMAAARVWNSLKLFYFNMEPRLKWNRIVLAAKTIYLISDVVLC